MSIQLIIISLVVALVLSQRALDVTRGTVNTNVNTATIVREVDDRVFFLQAEVAPITSLLRRIKRSVKVANPKFEWVEKDMGTPFTTADGICASGATTLNVAAGTGVMFTANDILWVPSTGEQIKVTSISTDALTVVRGYGTTSTAAIAASAVIVLLAPAFEEGSTGPSAISLNPTMPYNYTQIFRHAVEATRTEVGTSRYDGKNPRMVQLRNEAMILHMEAIERAYLFGELKIDLTGTNPRRIGKGIRSWITTNVDNCSGSFTKLKFDAFLEKIFRYGGRNKVLLMDSEISAAIHSEVLGNSNMSIEPKTKEWGLSIIRYKSPYGDIDLIYHRLLSQVWSGYGIALDLDNLEEKFLQKTIIKQNVQANDYDGFKDEIMTEAHIQFCNEKKHGIIYNP